jgi:hypothetical protein
MFGEQEEVVTYHYIKKLKEKVLYPVRSLAYRKGNETKYRQRLVQIK